MRLSDPVGRRIILLGQLPTGPQDAKQPAIIQIQKMHFGTDWKAAEDWVLGLDKLSLIDQNDIVSASSHTATFS